MMAWSVAFGLHSTFWLGLAWVGTRWAPQMHPRTRETIWQTAIAASLIGPSVLIWAPNVIPTFWQLDLPAWWFSLPSAASLVWDGEASGGQGTAGSNFEALLLRAWFLVAAMLLLRYHVQLAMHRRTLERRELGDMSPEAAALREVSRQAGLRRPPRLTHSDNLGSPIAMGFGSEAEICLPPRALQQLGSDRFRAMLGHEVAHHIRRDPVRLGIMNVLRAVFFFQPLLSIARREVHWAAEEQCDAWAARHVDDPLTVAQCLTEVAGWVLPREQRLPVVGLIPRPSHLVRRIDRLMDRTNALDVGGRSWRRLGSVSVLVLGPWMAPSLGPHGYLRQDIITPEPVVTELRVAPLVVPVESRSSEHADPTAWVDDDSSRRRGEHDGVPEAREARERGGEHSEGHN